jgi:HTH-type transcriptional regulator / antitoxin HigA
MAGKPLKPAEVFPPGEFLREELEARNWTQADLARVIGRPLKTVNEIVNGRASIRAETAKQLSIALGTSADLWMNLQASYDLFIARDADPSIERRARALATSK